MKRELDIEVLADKWCACSDPIARKDIRRLIAEVRRLRKRPRVPGKLVRMAENYMNIGSVDWGHKRRNALLFAEAILSEAKRKGRK